ncbi:MAG: hypothetical protein U0821_17190 [Chloroflexota bacterium]
MDDVCLEPGDGLALGKDDIDELIFTEPEHRGTIMVAAGASSQAATSCTCVTFVAVV